ncbi:hypothetical protein PHLH8_08260 [Pseudomonas sp. Pc102]|uniref:hypothetical protein n=1 Tax=Pseudomonas sp. Pc102 TaxID=2678261 RepID=UPI001BCB1013|nr:hypothetical protein [Pseudomonas sp. Pc102]BBP81184.1 hypothetical protein PHLH8_08260 [Pseudomonas sp. Pc102]
MFRVPTARDRFRSALDYHPHIYGMTDLWAKGQLSLAREALEKGLVDEMEYFEMRDLVLAVAAHARERVAADRVHTLGVYHAIEEGNGAVVGVMERRNLSAKQHPQIDALRAGHDATGQLRMMEDRIIDRGAIDRLTWTDSESGVAYRFHLVGHLQLGRRTPRIVDPDHYRLVRDLAREAIAAGNQTRADLLLERLHWAAWMRCLDCNENFALVDDCETCSGHGPVPAPPTPPSW